MRALSGYEPDTTNNRMEITAVIQGLRALKMPCRVQIITDSMYVKDAFTKGWLENWQRRGWITSDKKPVKNQDLWEELIVLQSKHTLEWRWVRGHSGDKYNEMCDELARKAIVCKRGTDQKTSQEASC